MPDVDASATRVVHTACRYCPAICGIDVTVDEATNRVVRIVPDKQNPYSWRDFCANGRTAGELVEHPRRLLSPMRRVGDRYVPASYEEAVDDIAGRVRTVIDRHGPDAVGSYHGNPSAFSLSNAVFFAGLLDAIGTRNRYWVGSIDQNSAHVVAEKLFGSPLVSLQVDVDDCDCLLLVGTNPAASTMGWLWSAPDGWKRALARRDGGADLIVVDPRRTETAAEATLHLAVRPGADWALLLGMVKVILEEGLDRPASAVPVVGLEAVRALAGSVPLDDLAARCDVSPGVIADVARRFARARTALCATATGVAQTTTGTVGEWLGMVLNLITDRVDWPGGRRYEPGLVDLARLFALIAPPIEHRTRLRGTPMVAGFHALGRTVRRDHHPRPRADQGDVHRCREPGRLRPRGSGARRGPEEPFVQYWRRAVEPPAGLRDEWEFFTDLALALDRNLFGKPGVNALIRGTRALARRTRRPASPFSWSTGAATPG